MGLLQTNGVTSSSVGGEGRGHSLYPIFSIVNNSCVSNTRSVKNFPKKLKKKFLWLQIMFLFFKTTKSEKIHKNFSRFQESNYIYLFTLLLLTF